MLPDIEKLFEVQVADREIRKLRDEIAALPKRVAEIEAKLAGHKASLEKARAAMKGDEVSRKKFETNILDQQGKISKYRDQSLAVKTNEQYRALMQEIQFAEQEIRINEDRILELMVNVEAREKDVKIAEAELKVETAAVEKEKAEARERTALDEKQLADWVEKRNASRSGVEANLLAHYERVLKFRGSGLAEVRDQKCMGCRVLLRPQTYNEIKSQTQVMTCESCQRILYFDPASETAADRPNEMGAHKKRARPKSDAAQAWFFRPDFGEDEVLMVYIHSGDTSSRRVYEMNTGRQIGDVLIREGNYRQAFPEDMTDSAIRLNGHWTEAQMEEWGLEVPTSALDLLQADLRAAHRDAARPGKSAHSAQTDTTTSRQR